MQSHSDRELWRTCLCKHGPDHELSYCRFAHSLSELRAPDESRVLYPAQWASGKMDRFYGQDMTSDQLDRIREYYEATPICDLPLWAIALRLVATCEECAMGFAYPWDFGLVRDYDDLVAARGSPIPVWPGLWERLDHRRRVLLAYSHPPHELGLTLPIAKTEQPQGDRALSSESPLGDSAVSPIVSARVSRSVKRSRSMTPGSRERGVSPLRAASASTVRASRRRCLGPRSRSISKTISDVSSEPSSSLIGDRVQADGYETRVLGVYASMARS